MDKKSLGQIFFNMKEQDEIRFIEKKTGKEYKTHGCQYTYNDITYKHVVTFFIGEIKNDERI